MTPEEIAKLPYRPCVGVVLINDQGRVFAGQRSDMAEPAWQMPQGGIDKGESVVEAALRELHEETGVAPEHVTVLGETKDWLPYDLPPEVLPYRGKYRGQTQKWVLMRLEAGDEVIDLEHEDVEFSDWRWMTATELLGQIVAFKRPIYEAVLREFFRGHFMPRNKHDRLALVRAGNVGFPDLNPYIPELLTWVQDTNWCVAPEAARLLAKAGPELVPHIASVFHSDDHDWAESIIHELLPRLRGDVLTLLRPEIERLAQELWLDEYARDVLKEHLGTSSTV